MQTKGGEQDLTELKEVAKDVAKQAAEAPSKLLSNDTLVKLTTVLTKTIGGGATYDSLFAVQACCCGPHVSSWIGFPCEGGWGVRFPYS